MRDISSESSLRLIVIYTEHAAPRVYMIVFKYVIRVIIALHIPETLESCVYTLLEVLNYVYLRHHLVSSYKHSMLQNK